MSVNQSQKAAWEEGVALGALGRVGDPEPPVDAFALARALGFELRPAAEREARLDGNVIWYPTRVHAERQHFQIALRLAQWLLLEADMPPTKSSVHYVAAALLIPERALTRHLRRTWDIAELKAIFSTCSAETIARRIVTQRTACVSITDGGRLKGRFASPLVPRSVAKLTPYEVDLARRVMEQGETIQDGSLLWGCAVFQGPWKRVITVCDARELESRLVEEGHIYAP